MKESNEKIIEQFEEQVIWLERLKEMDELIFFSPLAPGKWSVAALVSHFKSWDEFVLTSRVPLFNGSIDKGEKGPDQEEVNKNAQEYAHSGISQLVLIEEVLKTRREFVKTLRELPDDAWEKTYQLGESSLQLKDYIIDLTEHDRHHYKQVNF